jgi:hypothetical protein
MHCDANGIPKMELKSSAWIQWSRPPESEVKTERADVRTSQSFCLLPSTRSLAQRACGGRPTGPSVRTRTPAPQDMKDPLLRRRTKRADLGKTRERSNLQVHAAEVFLRFCSHFKCNQPAKSSLLFL